MGKKHIRMVCQIALDTAPFSFYLLQREITLLKQKVRKIGSAKRIFFEK